MEDSWLQLARARIYARPPGRSRHEHMRYLDNELLTLDTILANAKEIRNLQNLAVSFPEEILVDIISYVRDDPPPRHRLYGAWQGQKRHTCWQCGDHRLWTSVSGVCRRFRAIASCAILNATSSDRALPPTLLRRSLACSASVPLNLDLASGMLGSGLDGVSVLKYIKLNRERVRSLSLRGADGKNTLALQFLQRLGLFTNLNYLSLMQNDERSLINNGLANSFIIPLTSLGTAVEGWQPPPSITHLHLKVLPFPWTSTIYNDLVDLTLSRLTVENGNAPTLTVVNDLFQRMKRLETLTFDRVDIDLDPIDINEDELDAFEDDREEEVFVTEKVLAFVHEHWRNGQFALPATLKTWTVIFNTYTAALFLMRPSTSVTYILESLRAPHESDGLIKHFLSIHFPPPDGRHGTSGLGVTAPVTAIEFVVEDGPTALRARASYSRQTGSGASPAVVLHFNTEESFTPYECLNDLLDAHDRNSRERWEFRPRYDQVTELTLRCCVEYPGRDWRRYLRRLESLRVLRLSEDMLPTVLLGLRLRDDSEIPPHPAFRRYVQDDAALVSGPAQDDPSDGVNGDGEGMYARAQGWHDPIMLAPDNITDVDQVNDMTDPDVNFDIDDADIPTEAFMSEDDLYDGDDHLRDVHAATDIEVLYVNPSEQYGYMSSAYTVHLLLNWLALRKVKGRPLRILHVSPGLALQLEEGYAEEEGIGEWRSLLAISP